MTSIPEGFWFSFCLRQDVEGTENNTELSAQSARQVQVRFAPFVVVGNGRHVAFLAAATDKKRLIGKKKNSYFTRKKAKLIEKSDYISLHNLSLLSFCDPRCTSKSDGIKSSMHPCTV